MSSKRVQRKELDIISYHNNPILMAVQVREDNVLYIIGLDKKQVILWGHPIYNKKLYLKAFVKKVTKFIRKVCYTTFYYNKQTKVLFVGRSDGIMDILLFKKNEDSKSDFMCTLEYQLSVNIGRGSPISHIIETVTTKGVPVLLISHGQSISVVYDIFKDSIDVVHVLKLEKENSISRLCYTAEQRLLLVCDRNYQVSFFRLDLLGFEGSKLDLSDKNKFTANISYLATLSTADGHRGLIHSLAYDEGLNILLTGGAKNVCVWNTSTLLMGVASEPTLLYAITENIGAVNGVALYGGALLAVTADSGGAVIVTDLNKNVVIARFTAHHGKCTGLELDEVTGILLTWGNDRILKLWRLWEEADRVH